MKIFLVNVNLTASGVARKFLETIYEVIMKLYLAGNDGYHREEKFLDDVMKTYLAGFGSAGNIAPLRNALKDNMKIYMAETKSRKYCIDKSMFKDLNILESYYYLRKAENFMNIAAPHVYNCKNVLPVTLLQCSRRH